jgi:hypothetical protein
MFQPVKLGYLESYCMHAYISGIGGITVTKGSSMCRGINHQYLLKGHLSGVYDMHLSYGLTVLVGELICSLCSRARGDVLCSMFGFWDSVYWAWGVPSAPLSSLSLRKDGFVSSSDSFKVIQIFDIVVHFLRFFFTLLLGFLKCLLLTTHYSLWFPRSSIAHWICWIRITQRTIWSFVLLGLHNDGVC